MNGLQTLPQWREYFENPEGAILGLMNSVYPLGTVIGLLLVTYVCDRFGRRTPMFFGFAGAIGFAILQGLSKNLASFVIARALLGFSTSFMAQPSPILITELAYPTHRGKLTAMYNTFYVYALFSLTRRGHRVPANTGSVLVFRRNICSLVHLWHVQD